MPGLKPGTQNAAYAAINGRFSTVNRSWHVFEITGPRLPLSDDRQGAKLPKSLVFGKTADEQVVHLYVLVNRSGMEVKILTYGGIVVSVKCPDKYGAMEDVVLGYDNLADYVADQAVFGAIVGRYAGRIAQGKFTLHGADYTLARNDGENHLHGGVRGFQKRVWTVDAASDPADDKLTLTYSSEDGEEGYPGNLTVMVTYALTDDNKLRIEYSAVSDKPTVLNLTNHCCFNLAGHGAGDILNHCFTIHASQFLPINASLIPTGEISSVEGTPFDFTQSSTIASRIDREDPQLKLGKGYDHCWVLNPTNGQALSLAARVHEPIRGRSLEVWTTEPGLQFYTGNFLDGSSRGKNRKVYKHRYGFCLETQHFPDSPNHASFPSTILNPGQRFCSTTVYRFSVA